MKKMKYILAAVLVLCMMLSLCACGESSGNAEDTTTENEPIQTTTAEETVEDTTVDDGKLTYKVTVQDEAGNGIAAAMVQLCDEFCTFATADANGVATFNLEEGDYYASLMAMPEGYAHMGEEEKYYFEEGSTELTITLKAAE